MILQPAGLVVFTCPKTGRHYVDVADLAKITGLSTSALDRRHRPEAWGCPRDFLFDGGGQLWFALLSLPQLWDQLERAGESDAALKLRERMLPWVETAVAKGERSQESGVRSRTTSQ